MVEGLVTALGPEEVCYDTAREIEVARSRVFVEFWQFLKQEKKYWLAPLIFVLLILSLLMVFSQSSVLGPFIYTLF